MTISVIEHISGAAGGFSSTYSGGATPLAIVGTPAVGDVLLLRTSQLRSGVKGTSVSGCGATWTKIANSADTDERIQVWKGVGATASGTVTATFNGSTWATGAVTLVRGLAATTVVFAQDTNNASGSDPGPTLSAGPGQFVLATADSSLMSAYPSATAPASGWTSDAIVSAATGNDSGQSYRIPSASDTHGCDATNSNSTVGRHVLVVIGDLLTDVDISAPTATATAQGEVPTVGASVQTIDAPTATATAQGQAPTIIDEDHPSIPPTPPIGDPPGLVPLTVRIGNRHITREVSGLSFRKEAVGGVKSISLRLARPLDRFDADVTALASIYIYDGRSAETIAEGKVTDLGRSASAGDGQQWDVVAFGPAQHAADKTFPYILIDQSLEPWHRSEYSTKNASTQTDERGIDTPVLQVEAPEAKTISTSWQGDWINRVMYRAGMKLARISCDWDAGVTDADYVLAVYTRTAGGASPGNVDNDGANTAGGSLTAKVGDTNFTDGHDVVSLRVVRNTSGDTGAENRWFQFYNVLTRAMCKNADGTDITSGYTLDYVSAYRVVNDLLGRVLDQFDGANATVDSGGTYQIDQFAYPDGVTAEQVLTDLMALEPAYRWTTGPNLTGNGYSFSWEPWPTTVRYEVTLNDGGDFPASAQELYNEVTIRWRSRNGRTHTTTRTLACQILDDAGITRSTIIDAGDEIGSTNAAARLGDNFLAEHNVPANAGTINISRPIRDLVTNRTARPHQIEPGELIRVRGIESYPDALNASSNDGLTVFRIWSMTYSSDNDTSTLELDVPSRSTTNALARLAKRRTRKR